MFFTYILELRKYIFTIFFTIDITLTLTLVLSFLNLFYSILSYIQHNILVNIKYLSKIVKVIQNKLLYHINIKYLLYH